MSGTAIFRSIGRPWIVAATKSTIAAMAAWWLADRVIGSPQSFLAPYTALFMIGVTVRASGTAALRQVAVVTVGVAIAALAGSVAPVVPALAAAVAVGTVVGRMKVFAPDGMWVAITALLVLLYGTATDEVMVLYRIGDVALGAVVGLAVNAVVVPPEFLSEARDLIVVRSRGQAELLRNLARAVRDGTQVHRERRTELWELFKASGVTAALDRGRDSLRGNVRRRAWSRVGGDRIYRPAASTLDRTLISLAAVVVGVEGLSSRSEDSSDGLRDDVADLLDTVADALDELGHDPARHHSPYSRMLGKHLPEAMRLSEVVHEGLSDAGADAAAISTIVVAVDAIDATLYRLGEQ
ncbi:aromatic acid exporter family protein [Rhodococcus sp. 14-2470-1a]|uniref:FUSC family protein n=1 Tax=Rhodococcus sp. 14-2470-1a TaxID=2023150 RepID=UPI00211ADF6E|nr:FUSC family protein [Rhodococcus sp. 14-2470-1a]